MTRRHQGGLMASTYSARLRLGLQTNGENTTTWGTRANGVFSRIDDAIAGVASVALASDANYNSLRTTALRTKPVRLFW